VPDAEEGGRNREITVQRYDFTLMHDGNSLERVALTSLSCYDFKYLSHAYRWNEKGLCIFDRLLE
jgi:hypothetical protein